MAKTSPAEAPYLVPYVALGDSLTHGMQSIGVAWTSQRCSYPKLIADYLRVEPFAQPTMRGWDGVTPPEGVGTADDTNTLWLGNPPNIELILRAAQRELDAARRGTRTFGLHLPTIPIMSAAIADVHTWVCKLRSIGDDAILGTTRALAEADYQSYLCEQPASVECEGGSFDCYQNLGVFGFTIGDLSETAFDPAQLAPGASADVATRSHIRRALAATEILLERLSDDWIGVFRTHPMLLLHLVSGALALSDGRMGGHLAQEKLTYVLREPGMTVFQVLEKQQPRLVTLLIGANDILGPAGHGLFDAGGNPLYTPADKFRADLAALVDRILELPSHPDIFLGNLPSPTASPHFTRGRLGYWTSIVPLEAPLDDERIFSLEAVFHEYNQAIQDTVTRNAKAQPGGRQRVWLVDINQMQGRMVRATRRDQDAAQYVVAHVVRTGQLTQGQAQRALDFIRRGDRRLLSHIHDAEAQLLGRDVSRAGNQNPSLGDLIEYLTHELDAGGPGTADDLETFVVKLASGRTYRLTGEYLAGDGNGIRQGGAVSLDTLHLTNTGYAYMAREFIRAIYAADAESGHAVLRGQGFTRVPHSAADFDATIRRVALEDTLLNDVPPLSPTLAHLAGALGALRA